MNKLLALAPIALILTACGSAVHLAKPTPSQVQDILANAKTYKCDNQAEVVSVLTETNKDNFANVKITAPSLSLNQTALQLKQEVSASGERYVVSNADTSYEWHIKGNDGVLTVTTKGKDYSFSCQTQ